MAELTIIYWRDIPAQIIARVGRKNAKRELPTVFQQAIDHAAMRAGAKDSDAYLAAWRRSDPTPCGDDLEAEVARVLSDLVTAYDTARLKALIASGGHEARSEPQHLVVFAPSGKRGRFPAGTSLLEAARALLVDLDSVCGGRGLCGRCKIRVQVEPDARLASPSTRTQVSATEAVEARYQEKRGKFAPGERLGCQAQILGDLIIDVPASSQIHRQIIRKDATDAAITLDPVVTLHFVEVSEPSLEEVHSDVTRLRQALAEHWDIHDVALPLAVLARLQSILREGGWKVTLALRHRRLIVAIYPGLKEQIAGIAVDIGSTTIAAHLCSLNQGDLLASGGIMNPQIRFGEDVMSRVSYAMTNTDGTAQMSAVVRQAINGLVGTVIGEAGLQREDIAEMVIVGNPIMHHLLLGIDPSELGTAPFALAIDEALDVPALSLNLELAPGALVHLLPCMAGHVGADASAMVLAEEPQTGNAMTLLVDVGTNAEIILGNATRLLACSSPTGPAFEGAQLSSGQRAAPGAIERITIDQTTFEPRYRVIGIKFWSDEPGFEQAAQAMPLTGLCGSGIIDIIAELALCGLIYPDGAFNRTFLGRTPRLVEEGRSLVYVIHDRNPRITITQNDVRAVQLAKAALHAGCKLLMARMGIAHVDRIRLAGAFGAHIDPLHALALGLVPDCVLEHVTSAGNAAGHGARIALLNAQARIDIARLVGTIEKIETALDPLFQKEFISAMAIPHAEDGYPHTAHHLVLPLRVDNTNRPRRRRDRLK